MTTFLYKGSTKDGGKIGGAKSFNSRSEMENYVDSLNILNVEIFESKTKYSTKKYQYVSPKELSIFCGQMSVLFFSFMTLLEGVDMLAEQTNNSELTIALNEIHEFMNKGYTFSEVFQMYDHMFEKYLIQMILIGEESGNLDTIFADMSLYYEKESNTRKKVKSAITFPLILSAMMFLIILFLVKAILPMFDSMLTSMGATPSLITESIIGATNALNSYGLIVLLLIVVVSIGLKIYFGTEKGSFVYDKLKVTLPYVKNINIRIITTRFSKSLAIQLKSGIQVVNALEQSIALVDNKYLEKDFRDCNNKVKDGENIATALQEVGIFPKLFINMVIIGQSTGNIDIMLNKCAKLFEDEVDDSFEKLTRFIEPVLITILSLIVGVILLAIILPMVNIMEFI